MKKLLIGICFLLGLCSNNYSQEIKKQESKFDQFSSKTGITVKFIDYDLPDLELRYDVAEAKIRKIIAGNEAKYFFLISKEGKYDTKNALIAYEDLIEVIKAFQKIKQESLADIASNPDYLENKFVTEDGFKLGYYVNKGDIAWYASLDKYGSDNTIFFKDVETIDRALSNAKLKIEELKK